MRAKFVWYDSSGEGRNRFGLFRREVEVRGVVREALLHLFADSRYRVRVNGEFVATGPARFVPTHPEYDVVDLGAFLKEGANVITVEVNAMNARAFQIMPGSIGGFIAWGAVISDVTVDLETPGDWKVRRMECWDSGAPSFSFAQGPVEILDFREVDPAWYGLEGGDGWGDVVELERQDAWGPLEQRSVPALEYRQFSPERVLRAANILNDEWRFGCRTYQEGERAGKDRDGYWYCYYLWIHSPIEQEVDLGLFWGPHYLNGDELILDPDPERGNRRNATVQLKHGWNLLYGEVAVLTECWSMLVGVPRAAGLAVAATPESRQSEEVMCYSRPLRWSELQERRRAIPTTAEELDALRLEWSVVRREDPIPAPAREFAWDQPDGWLLEDVRYDGPLSFELEAGGAVTVLFDMGIEFLGQAIIEVSGPAGTFVDISNDERLRNDGLLGMYLSNPFADSVDRYVLAGGFQRIVGFHPRGGRFVQVTFRAPRGEGGTVELNRFAVRQTQIPLQLEGGFRCSDSVFDWAWDHGIETLQACLEDMYLDCPWRERGLYLGDSYVEHRVHRTLETDLSVAARSLRLWAQAQLPDGQMQAVIPAYHQRPHGDFSLIWILFLEKYWELSGDVDLVRSLWGAVDRILASAFYTEDETGLWSAEGAHIFVDWGAEGAARQGERNAALNTLRVGALNAAARMAELIGDAEQAVAYREQSERVAAAIRTELWDNEGGWFAASIEEGEFAPCSPVHANILALLYDVAAEEQRPQILQKVVEFMEDNAVRAARHERQQGHVELYFLSYVLDVFYREGQYAAAERVIRTHYGIVKDGGGWTVWETLANGAKNKGSLCHAWSCAASYAAMHEVLGVQQAERGSWKSVVLRPAGETIYWAEGTFPLEEGLLGVRWESRGTLLFVDVTVPVGVEVTIEPRGRLAGLKLVARVEVV